MDDVTWTVLFVIVAALAGVVVLWSGGKLWGWRRLRAHRRRYLPPKGHVVLRTSSYVDLINDRERLRQLRAKIERES